MMRLPKVKIGFLPSRKDKPRAVVLERFRPHPMHGDDDVPRGFEYDGSTKVSLLWRLIHIGMGSFGEQNEGSLIHDWRYVHDGKMPNGKVYTRKEIDELFLRMILDYGIRPDRAIRAYRAVRLFGWIPWMLGDGTPKILTEEKLEQYGYGKES